MPGFRHCRWCDGKGCICCDSEQAKWEAREAERQKERDAEYDRLFPNGPTPMFTARTDNPDDMAAMARILRAAMNPKGIAEAPPLVRGLARMLAADPEDAKAVERQYASAAAAERTAESERFLQRHRPDPPEYKPIGNPSAQAKGEA